MEMEERADLGRRILRLWERGPRWPRDRQPDDVQWEYMCAGMRRWTRDPEPFEKSGTFEPYPAATVLEDLEADAEETATLRILARYAVARLFLMWCAGVLTGARLAQERRVATGHLQLLPTHDWERRSLERLVAACRALPTAPAAAAAMAPAENAAKRNHFMGAYALYRTIYEVSVRQGWWQEGAAAAHGIARVSIMCDAPRSQRIWRWRARVLETRHRTREARRQE